MTRLDVPLVPANAPQREAVLGLEDAHDAHACGSKAANLGRMLRAGLPVPPGIVLTEHARQAYAADVARAKCSAELRRVLAGHIVRLPGAGALAVRSSAAGEDSEAASYAGLLDSVLHVDRGGGALDAVARVWSSLHTARTRAYERSRGRALTAMGVILQAQIDAYCAGVLFTRSPETGREHEMLCEFCSGLADRLVAGEIDPARIAIDRDTLSARPPVQAGAPADAVLGPEQVETLAVAALACERLFDGPQDIEWVIDTGGKLWIVQSRPITARTTPQPRVFWSNANVNENFPAPISPLLYSIAAQGYEHYFRNLGVAFGLAPSRLARMAAHWPAIIGVHAGRMYYNLTAIHAILRAAPFGDHLATWFDEFTGAHDPDPAAARPGDAGRGRIAGAWELASICVHVAYCYARIGKRVAAFEQRIDDYARRTAPERLAARTPLELRELLREFMHIRLHEWNNAALADAAAMTCYGVLKTMVRRVAPSGANADALNHDLLKGLCGLKSAEPVEALWMLARSVRESPALTALFENSASERIEAALASDSRFAAFHRAFTAYVERYGFRCSGELMLTVPSFQERPRELIDILRAYARTGGATPEAKLQRQRVEREQATARIVDAAGRQRIVPWLPWPNRATLLAPLIAATQAAIGLRERARFQQALLYSRLRRLALRIGACLTARGFLARDTDVFLLTCEELDQLLAGRAMFPGETRRLVALRSEAHAAFDAMQPPDAFSAPAGTYPHSAAPAARGGAPVDGDLRGTSVCGGVTRGHARVLQTVAETHQLGDGDVLVTRQTDPGWAPAFVTISGLVLERGGMLSHGAILAREYGIPTIVGVAGATARIRSGDSVEVDADQGHVRVLA